MLARRFPQLVNEMDLQKLSDECLVYDSSRSILPEAESVEDYWQEVGEMKDEGKPRFPHLTTLAKGLLILPHGNADVERIFSHLKLIHTDKRNLLGASTINSILHAKFQDTPCYSFKPDFKLIAESKKATKRHLSRPAQAIPAPAAIADPDIAIVPAPSTSSCVATPKISNTAAVKQRTISEMFKRKRSTPLKNADYFTGDFTVSDSD